MLPARLFESGFTLSSWLSSALCAGDGTLQPHRPAEPPRVQEVPSDEVVRGLVWLFCFFFFFCALQIQSSFAAHAGRWLLTELTLRSPWFQFAGQLMGAKPTCWTSSCTWWASCLSLTSLWTSDPPCKPMAPTTTSLWWTRLSLRYWHLLSVLVQLGSVFLRKNAESHFNRSCRGLDDENLWILNQNAHACKQKKST